MSKEEKVYNVGSEIYVDSNIHCTGGIAIISSFDSHLGQKGFNVKGIKGCFFLFDKTLEKQAELKKKFKKQKAEQINYNQKDKFSYNANVVGEVDKSKYGFSADRTQKESITSYKVSG